MVHRLLAALIGVDSIHPVMTDRRKLIRLTENMNKRHRKAQYASRASILLNTFLMVLSMLSLKNIFISDKIKLDQGMSWTICSRNCHRYSQQWHTGHLCSYLMLWKYSLMQLNTDSKKHRKILFPGAGTKIWFRISCLLERQRERPYNVV